MKKIKSALLSAPILLFLILVLSFHYTIAQQTRIIKQGVWNNHQVEYISNQIAVKIKKGVNIQDIAPVFSKFNATVIKNFNKLGWGLIEVPQDSDIIPIISELKENVLIENGEPNFVEKLQYTPNDPYFLNGYQWNLKNTGQAPPDGIGYGTAGADINADSAWNITQGSSSIIIAILDTGIPLDATTYQLNHPDLNDANKFILGPNETDDTDGVRDNNGHGSHVTGIASAITNNGIGIAGVAGGCKVMVIKAFDSVGNGYPIWFQNGVIYAVDHGAKIINYSGGSPVESDEDSEAIDYANSHNVLVAAAVGNDFSDPIFYPAAFSLNFPNLIAVGSTDNTDTKSDFSDVGAALTVVAPGSDIYSTIPTYPTEYSVTHGGTVNYAQYWGTSQATPQVSGTAALILSINLNITPSQVRQILINTAKKVSGMNGQNFTTSYGYGRINAYNALKYTLENYGGTLTQNIIIPSGDTWTFQPGVTLNFSNGASLIVNGVLSAVGTSSNPITFNFGSPNSSTQNGIIFNSGSSGTISYCRILNAYSGIYENSASVNVSNSAITQCTFGLYLYNSSPTIQSCTIDSNSEYGIYLISSSPYLYGNYIQKNYMGVNCSATSNPTFGSGTTKGDNNITNNTYGIFCQNNSTPMIGNNSPVNGGYNNLENTNYNVYNMSSNSVYAENNWWNTTNTSQFKIAGESPVVYSPYLTSAVNIPSPPLMKSAVNLYTAQGSSTPLLSQLNQANQLIASNNLVQARAICMNMITNYPDSSYSYNALNLLKEIYPAADSVKNVYQLLFNNTTKKDLYAMAGLILADVDTANKLSHINDVINSYGTDNIVEYALFDKFVYYHFDKGDKQNAAAVLSKLDNMFLLSSEDIEVHIINGDTAYYKIDLAKKPALQEAVSQIPTVYALFNNYPNPFNPSTIIQYQLPTNGMVTIKVYDILGREVKTLVNDYKTAGNYSVSFDASKLASGIYFYQIRAGNFITTKKMMLVK
ncbi:MAG: S8 family serine peptidase [Ignavibacteriaceae bacterium]